MTDKEKPGFVAREAGCSRAIYGTLIRLIRATSQVSTKWIYGKLYGEKSKTEHQTSSLSYTKKELYSSLLDLETVVGPPMI